MIQLVVLRIGGFGAKAGRVVCDARKPTRYSACRACPSAMPGRGGQHHCLPDAGRLRPDREREPFRNAMSSRPHTAVNRLAGAPVSACSMHSLPTNRIDKSSQSCHERAHHATGPAQHKHTTLAPAWAFAPALSRLLVDQTEAHDAPKQPILDCFLERRPFVDCCAWRPPDTRALSLGLRIPPRGVPAGSIAPPEH